MRKVISGIAGIACLAVGCFFVIKFVEWYFLHDSTMSPKLPIILLVAPLGPIFIGCYLLFVDFIGPLFGVKTDKW